jgi:hypothetical protein
MSLPERYVFWNYALAEQCLLTDTVQGQVLLTVTPRILAAALANAGEPPMRSDEAEADFTSAVAEAYRSAVLAGADGLRALAGASGGDPPASVSYLAASVLAAYHMRTDDERTGRAYHPRFAGLLGCGLAGTVPAGFDGDTFISLWLGLAHWLEVGYGRRLALPTGSGVRKYLPYPFAHVPLRQVDIERLPHFFDAHGYEPGARPPLDKLAYDLYEGAGPWRELTDAGQRALADPDRRAFVVRQAAQELESWDGCRTDTSGKRIATIEVWMDIRRRRAHLFLLARRPQGFPSSVEDGEFQFESSQDGWYEPVALGPDDGALLRDGMRVGTRCDGRGYALQLRPVTVVPLTPSEEFSGPVSDSVLRRDAHCAVLCQEALAEPVAAHIGAITGTPARPRRDETLPRGWCLFTDVVPKRAVEPPARMPLLRVESSLALVPQGGLRLGRRWTWLETVPPALTISGTHQGMEVRVDGTPVSINGDGTVPGAALRAPGQHVVEIGNQLRQRITVLPATVHPACKPWLEDGDARAVALVAVPRGAWSVLGESPGQRIGVSAPAEGALVDAGFGACWAVSVAAGAGATAIHLHATAPSTAAAPGNPGSDRRPPSREDLAWAGAVYEAAIRRVRLRCACGCSENDLDGQWRKMAEAARRIKRRARRAPR